MPSVFLDVDEIKILWRVQIAFLNTIIIKYKYFVHLNTYKDIKIEIFYYSGFYLEWWQKVDTISH